MFWLYIKFLVVNTIEKLQQTERKKNSNTKHYSKSKIQFI
jgi:hypothetical protein